MVSEVPRGIFLQHSFMGSEPQSGAPSIQVFNYQMISLCYQAHLGMCGTQRFIIKDKGKLEMKLTTLGQAIHHRDSSST
jgi:hypothetical protein